MRRRQVRETETVGLFAVMLAVGGCADPTAVGTGLMQTGRDEYDIVATQGGVEVGIDYSFSNRTSQAVYLPNCRGEYFFRLERLEGDEWVSAWDPPRFLCLSDPIVIDLEHVFTDTLGIRASYNDPSFERVALGGTFRIVLTGAVTSYDEGGSSPTPLPLDQRVSNAFELREP